MDPDGPNNGKKSDKLVHLKSFENITITVPTSTSNPQVLQSEVLQLLISHLLVGGFSTERRGPLQSLSSFQVFFKRGFSSVYVGLAKENQEPRETTKNQLTTTVMPGYHGINVAVQSVEETPIWRTPLSCPKIQELLSLEATGEASAFIRSLNQESSKRLPASIHARALTLRGASNEIYNHVPPRGYEPSEAYLYMASLESRPVQRLGSIKPSKACQNTCIVKNQLLAICWETWKGLWLCFE